MIIKSLDLEHFGKFHHKKIELGPRVNIVYGGNEAGKSTVHRFIHAMLFGAARGRGKAAGRDEYTRYQPWQDGRSYEGFMVFEYHGHVYRLYRNFYKEDAVFKVFDETAGRGVSLPDGQIDTLIPGLTEANFKNTVSLRQQESRIDDKFASSLQSYMANITMGKNEAVDIAEAMAELSDKERQFKRRIHGNRAVKIRDDMERLEQEIENAGDLSEAVSEAAQDEKALEENILKCREDMKKFQTRERRERMEGRALIEKYQMVSKLFQEEKQKSAEQESKAKHYFLNQFWFKFFAVMTVTAALLMAVQFGMKLDLMWLKAVTGLFLCAAFIGIAKTSFKKPVYRAKESGQTDFDRQLKEISAELSPYIKKYGRDMMAPGQFEEMSGLLNSLMKEKEVLLQKKEKLIYQQEHKDELEAKYEMLKEAWEEIELNGRKYEAELKALALAKQVIGAVSGEIHSTFGSRMNEEAKQVFETIVSDGNRRPFYIDEKLDIHMDGLKQQIPIERLSAGTIDQLYFALRFCAGRLIFGKSTVPVILDDAFAFYDDSRLKNFLSWIIENYGGQLIFFTCHHREADILDELGYDYNYIEL